MTKSVEILDTTLRDGAQAEGISFTVQDKINIMNILSELGIHITECGNPYSNPKDRELFACIGEVNFASRIASFGSTRKKGVSAGEDSSLKALCDAGTTSVSMVGKTSLYQVRTVLETTPEENLNMISDSVAFLKDNAKTVYFDCEHFFDGFKEDSAYSLSCLEAAVNAGCDCLVLCDTNGSALPYEVSEIMGKVKERFPQTKIGVHFHDDLGLATANTITAVTAGATHIQGTLLGFGERCGNAALCEIIPTLTYKMGYETIPKENIPKLFDAANAVARVCEHEIPPSMPYVGKNAFAHKGGMHIDGVLKNTTAFEHISPQMVGNNRNILLSEVSGKGAILEKAGKIIPFSGKDDERAEKVLEVIKEKERNGFMYENADASFELLVKSLFGLLKEYFTVELYRVMGEKTVGAEKNIASAMVKVNVNGTTEFAASEGNGPVNAMDGALRRGLEVFFPSLRDLRLTDYRVRVVNPDGATASTVRVNLTSQSERIGSFTTIGVSTDVIDASFNALYDSYIYYLSKVE